MSRTLFWSLSNAQAWQRYSVDLMPFAGKTIVLRLGVLNDGLGGQTALYIDNASLITDHSRNRVGEKRILGPTCG